MGKIRHNRTEHAAPWIYNPWLDLIVGCGAWSGPLLLISYFSVASSARTWSVVFYALALFFNYPHYMATIYRAYHRAEDFQKYRVFTVHITGLMLLTLLLSHFWLQLLPWIFTIYLTWSPWHYSGQNYGLFMMFARRAGATPDKGTRRALYGAFVVSYLILFLGFHTGPSTDPLFISLGIPAIVSRWEQVILLVAFFALSAYGLYKLASATGWRKLIPSLTLFSSQFLWFLLPALISLVKGWSIPQNRYSSGVLAVMHSAQYLWITSYYARREATDEPAKKDGRWRPLAYFSVLIVGGIALFVPGPWLASRAFHHDFTASFLIFTALVNIHHFILDGAIWKLRDGRIASLLLDSRDRISNAATGAASYFVTAGRWFVGNTASARFVRVAAVLLLLAWGAVDQARYYLALHAEGLEDLERAAALNSFDSTLQTKLGQRALEAGLPNEAESAWKRAIRANASDPSPRQALLRLLIDQNRYDEAYDLTEASLKYSPRDANLLFNRGLLAQQRGQSDVAIASWQQVLAVDPHQMQADLYLADALDRAGKAQAAAAHYTAFLEKIAHEPAAHRPPPDKLIAIILRLAVCQSRSSQTERAVKSYELAEKMAAQTNQPRLEGIAAVNAAELQAHAGKLDDALQLYQHALQLDASVGDASASADDWLAYGRFLDASGFPPRLAYACLVKSETLRDGLPDSASPDPLDSTRLQLEKQIGPEAAAIRRHPEPALREALVLHR